MSDEELMIEAQKFDKNLLNFFWRHGVSYYEGQDLVQETYLRLWKYRDEYEPTAKLSTFLFTLAGQVWVDALRRQAAREDREKLWVVREDLARETKASPVVGRENVRWAVSRLSKPLRDVVELGLLQDLPYDEVSRILGIPVGTVKSRMFNALKKLKELVTLYDKRFGTDAQ